MTVLLAALLILGVCALSLWLTRRIADGAYFRRPLAQSRWPWIVHIPTYALATLYVMNTITALTGFPLNLDAATFMGRNLYGIWSLFVTLASAASALSLITVVGVPLVLWILTQKVRHRRPRRQRQAPRPE